MQRILWTLLIGDLIVLLIFALMGRADHGMSLSAGDIFQTALPFILGWLIVAPLMKALRPEAVQSIGRAAYKAATTWIVAGIAGLIIRSMYLHREIDWLFALITIGFNLVLFVVWRSLYAWIIQRKAA